MDMFKTDLQDLYHSGKQTMVMETGRSQERVTAALNTLHDAYDSFSIHQTSMSVDRETYECVAQRCEQSVVEADVKVQHDDGVLVIETDGVERMPHGSIEASDSSIEAGAHRLVKEHTGVSCNVVDLVSANIVGIHDTSMSERSPVYRLSALFEAVYRTGEPHESARWHRATTAPVISHSEP